MVYMREIWQDEFEGDVYDIKPYKYGTDAYGRQTDVKVPVTLDRAKRYMIAFLDKTRNDEDGRQVVFEFEGRYNTWTEIGRCMVFHSRDN